MKDLFFINVSSCIAVRGFHRNVIMDLSRFKFFYAPNSLLEFLEEIKTKSTSDIYKETPKSQHVILDEYFKFCINNEFILEIPRKVNKKYFPQIKWKYNSPCDISNCCIEISKSNYIKFEALAVLIRSVKCYHIQLIYLDSKHLSEILSNLDTLSTIGLRSIELVLPYTNDIDYFSLVEKYNNISFIYLYSAPQTKLLKDHYYGVQRIFSSKNKLNFNNDKTINNFRANFSLYNESIKFNSYFNKKLYVSSLGEIKNSRESTENFGTISDLSVEDLRNKIKSKKFQKYWLIHKGLIDVCKVCEYRFMCVDSRTPLKRNKKEWYFDTECNYNPFIGKWKGQYGYKSVSECGIISNNLEFKMPDKLTP